MTPQDEHPDPTGPERPDNKDRALDGEPKPSNVRSLRQEIDSEHAKNGNGSIADRVGDGEDEDDVGQEQLFVIPEGRRNVRLGSIVKSNTPTELRLRMGSGSVRYVSGLLDPYDTSVLLIVDGVMGAERPTYIRDDQRQVEKVIVYQEVKPSVIHSATSAAGLYLLAEQLKVTPLNADQRRILQDALNAAPVQEELGAASA